MAEDTARWRYFGTYSGVKLPLRLVSPLEPAELSHRNTFIRARFDEHDRLVECEKMVYGEVHLAHRYAYGGDGGLSRAEIVMDDETTVLEF